MHPTGMQVQGWHPLPRPRVHGVLSAVLVRSSEDAVPRRTVNYVLPASPLLLLRRQQVPSCWPLSLPRHSALHVQRRHGLSWRQHQQLCVRVQ